MSVTIVKGSRSGLDICTGNTECVSVHESCSLHGNRNKSFLSDTARAMKNGIRVSIVKGSRPGLGTHTTIRNALEQTSQVYYIV